MELPIEEMTEPADDVSIVLTTYNREKVLPRTIESILAQSYPHFELLICDDGSTDGTRGICEGYAAREARVRYIRSPGNLGMPANLNHGIRLCKHELIANLHDGDIYAPTLIEKWRGALLRYPTAGFVFNRYVHLSPDEKTEATTWAYPELTSGRDFLERFVFPDRDVEFPVWGTVMARRSVYLEMNLFDGRYSFWADIDMWCRIAERYDIAHVPEPLIRLPSRAALPHFFNERMFTAHAMFFRIHWKARTRHYRGRPWQLAAALSAMCWNFVTIRTVKLARRIKRQYLS